MSKLKEIVVVSGRSGAGKSTVSKVLEDMGYFVVDNLPPQLIDGLLMLFEKPRGQINKIAVIIDVRETQFLPLMPQKWQEIDDNKYLKRLFYLDASDKQLIDRYQETKRRHPLDDGKGIKNALSEEHLLLEPIRNLATKIIFTDRLNAHELKNLIRKEIVHDDEPFLKLTLMSFGFKHGIPLELDLCFDVRFLTNPYYVPKLKPKTGLDPEVLDYVFSFPAANIFLEKTFELIQFLLPLYREEGKSSLTIAIGCTGGQHRSVAIVEALAKKLADNYLRIEHRDLPVLGKSL